MNVQPKEMSSNKRVLYGMDSAVTVKNVDMFHELPTEHSCIDIYAQMRDWEPRQSAEDSKGALVKWPADRSPKSPMMCFLVAQRCVGSVQSVVHGTKMECKLQATVASENAARGERSRELQQCSTTFTRLRDETRLRKVRQTASSEITSICQALIARC